MAKPSFPARDFQPAVRGPLPQTTHPPNLAGDYPGAPMQSDAGTLANVPPREAAPGDGAPGMPWETPSIPARRRLR